MTQPLEISETAREATISESDNLHKANNGEPYKPIGHFVQLAINLATADRDKVILGLRKQNEWLKRKFLPCPDCRDKVKEGVCLRCENQQKDRVIGGLKEDSARYRGMLDRFINGFLSGMGCPAFNVPTGIPDSSDESEQHGFFILKNLLTYRKDQLQQQLNEAVSLRGDAMKHLQPVLNNNDRLFLENERLQQKVHGLEASICIHHNDDERSKIHGAICPVCITRERDQLERELNQCVTALKAVANRKTIGDEFDARKLVASALKNTKSAAEPANEKGQP